jgi:hypothetical protein
MEDIKLKNIGQKIQIIKKRLLESNLKKSGYNKFSNFKYYELQDFVPNIIRLCNDFGLLTVFDFTETEGTLKIIDIDDMNSKIEYRVPMTKPEIKGCNEVQNLGGSITYLKRYLFINAFDIIENDQFDAQDMRIKYKCEECGKEFKDDFYKDNPISAEQQFEFCKKKFGKALCKACRKLGGYDDLLEKHCIKKN